MEWVTLIMIVINNYLSLKGGRFLEPFIFCFNLICCFKFTGFISLTVSGVILLILLVGLNTG